MRIAYVCADPGIPVFGSKGASIHVQAVLHELCRRGHDVHLVTPRAAGTSSRVRVHPLPAVSGRAAAERERSAQRSDSHVATALDAVGPDAVYERYSLWGMTATRWADQRGVRSILEVNAPLVEEQARYRELVDRDRALDVARSAMSLATATVCVSEPVAAWARRMSHRPHRVAVVANGVDTDRITPSTRPVALSGARDFTVGFVGTLKAWHGLEVLFQAMAQLVVDTPTWRLLVVGDGPLRETVEQLAARHGIAGHVQLTGAVPSDRVAAELHRMDIAVAPYPQQDQCYFSPLKVYEYLAAGLPVVASATGQLPELLDGGRLGRLVAPGDPMALAVALRALRADHAERAALRVRTRRAAVERHTWSRVVDRAFALVEPATVAP